MRLKSRKIKNATLEVLELPGTPQHKERDFPGFLCFPDMGLKTHSLNQLLAAKDAEDYFYLFWKRGRVDIVGEMQTERKTSPTTTLNIFSLNQGLCLICL